ncbi:MAG: hypothetical protein CMK09_00955 [Ponticaulis sp.]|nr:hypothetical protein [Ponticaulis sp.]|tara:strand:- start:25438 stop:26445 length:1008 start_codon:yes stop_codon:yes gene_type:complete
MILRTLIALAFSGLALPAIAQTCEETQDKHAVKIAGTDSQGRLNTNVAPEIYGNHNFMQELDNGWVFVLSAARWGWQIAVFDDETDVTAGTPPLRGPNPREIYGWHFRDADNTGPNTGEVNAPQHMRAFVLSPRAAGTPPGPDDGIGWLKIEDFGLSDLEPGEQARMSYLKFNACLSWPKTEADKASESLDFSEVDQEIFGSCGLDLAKYRLEAAICTSAEACTRLDSNLASVTYNPLSLSPTTLAFSATSMPLNSHARAAGRTHYLLKASKGTEPSGVLFDLIMTSTTPSSSIGTSFNVNYDSSLFTPGSPISAPTDFYGAYNPDSLEKNYRTR